MIKINKEELKITGILLMKFLQETFLSEIYFRFSCTSPRQSRTFNFSFVSQNI